MEEGGGEERREGRKESIERKLQAWRKCVGGAVISVRVEINYASDFVILFLSALIFI